MFLILYSKSNSKFLFFGGGCGFGAAVSIEQYSNLALQTACASVCRSVASKPFEVWTRYWSRLKDDLKIKMSSVEKVGIDFSYIYPINFQILSFFLYKWQNILGPEYVHSGAICEISPSTIAGPLTEKYFPISNLLLFICIILHVVILFSFLSPFLYLSCLYYFSTFPSLLSFLILSSLPSYPNLPSYFPAFHLFLLELE